jgi:hypothetical protein
MVLDILLAVVAGLMVGVGVIGSIIPVIPGPIISILSLYLLSLAGEWAIYSWPVLIVLTVIALAVTVLDNVLPATASKKAGAGRPGVIGSVIGMLVGSFLIPPFGVILGAFVGALLGEMIFNPENEEPLKAALGVFRGTLLATILKLAAAGAVGVYYVIGVIRLFRG